MSNSSQHRNSEEEEERKDTEPLSSLCCSIADCQTFLQHFAERSQTQRKEPWEYSNKHDIVCPLMYFVDVYLVEYWGKDTDKEIRSYNQLW